MTNRGAMKISGIILPRFTFIIAMFIQSALVYTYYLLPFSMIVVCVMIAGRETENNGILKMLALPVSRYVLSAAKFCVLLFYLFMEMVVFLILSNSEKLISYTSLFVALYFSSPQSCKKEKSSFNQ
mgnify:CR=1 FL=1